jgi:hypothetical protein
MRPLAEAASRIPRMRVGIDVMLLQEVAALKDAKSVLTRVKDIPKMDEALKQALDAQVNPKTRTDVQKTINIFAKVKSDELTPMIAALERNDLATVQEIYKSKYAASYDVRQLMPFLMTY